MLPASLRSVLCERRLWLLALCSALALVLGVFAIPDSWAMPFVRHAGYWTTLVSFSLFVYSLSQVLSALAAEKGGFKGLLDLRLLALCLAGLLGLLIHERMGFKIVMDELMLLGTSMSMHFDRLAIAPMRGNDLQGAFVIVEGIVDKRPLFFPFLASVVHDLSGYRPSNVFVLNGLLTGVFLYLVGTVGRLFAGRAGQVLAVLLFVGLPLLGHNALGGGFEILNLTMIVVTFLLGLRYVEAPNASTLAALVFSGILLAQTRYESVIYVLPVAVIVIRTWLKEGAAVMDWRVLICPFLMVIVPVHLRVFSLQPSSWEMASLPGYTKPFALAHIPDNLAHALGFFFAPPHEQPSYLVFSLFGWVAVLFSLLILLRWLRGLRGLAGKDFVTLVFLAALTLQFVFLMTYFWGRFDHVVIRRLSLPTHLWLMLSILLVMPELVKSLRIQWALVGVAVLGYIGLSVPAMARHAYSQEYLPGLEVAWRRAFMATQPYRDYLVIDNDCTLWVSHKVSATFMGKAISSPESFQFHLRNHTFSNIYVFQRLEVDAETGQAKLRKGDDLGPNFELETVREERLQALTITRMSRVVGVRNGDTLVRPGNVRELASPEHAKDKQKVEELRMKYLENYLRQLP